MSETIKHEGIFFDYKYEGDLFYKDKYTNKVSDIAYIDLYHHNKFVSMAYVWCDNEMNGREYIEINHTAVYLDTIRTLVSIDALINNVCKVYEVTLEELQSESKKIILCEPRNILYYILREEYGMHYQAIAGLFHRISHASVMNGCKKIKGYMELTSKYAKSINALVLTEFREQEELEMN